MAVMSFDQVWQLLPQLEGEIVTTLVYKRCNKVIKVMPNGIRKQAEKSGGRWGDATLVRKRVFEEMWERLSRNRSTDAGQGDWAFAAACLVAVPALGVEYVEGKTPRTLVLQNGGESRTRGPIPNSKAPEKLGGSITSEPNICGGKPTIHGTRIMVKNILGMLAGGYSTARILRAYPDLAREDVSAALEYASMVIDEEKVIARS